MSLETFIQAMPKVELHVHLEGSIRPETLLTLARRNGVTLPANSVEALQRWYTFTDFPHFIEIYLAVCSCICTPDDIELITHDLLIGQAAQNIVHTEATYTAMLHYRRAGITFEDQLAAINRARVRAEQELGVTLLLIIDIPREQATSEEADLVADWAVSGLGNGVAALGLGGYEVGFPPEKFTSAFARARAAGLPGIPHAGETEGAASIWGALNSLQAVRIGHGVRCLEDPALVEELRVRQVPLEVSPNSNVCLKVVPNLASHPLPRLLQEGLYVTLNSDDPPMFNTTLTKEYLDAATTFGLGITELEQLSLNALRASQLPEAARQEMENRFTGEFTRLRAEHL